MVKLRDLNEYITCFLCKGYMVNATAVSECMHTFCRGCIVKEFIKNSSCPQCGISVNPTEPTKTLKSDNQLQDLINKIVPGFADSERTARAQFYASRGEPEENVVESMESTFLTPKKRALYGRQAGLPVYVMLQHERNTAASTMRIKRYPGHMIRFPSELTVLHLKEFIRQRLSISFDLPEFEDAKAQKAWERDRLLAIKQAPDVDILYGDYLLDEDVTLGLLSRIRHGVIKQAVLALTYRFRGTLKGSQPTESSPEGELSQSLTPTADNTSPGHVSCLNKGKGKEPVSPESGVNSDGVKCSAPLAPRQLLVKKPVSGRKNNVVKSPANHKGVVITKSPVMKKSIIIQHSSKPPVHIAPKPVPRFNSMFMSPKSLVPIAPKPGPRASSAPVKGTILSRPNSASNTKSRIILPSRQFKGDAKRAAIQNVLRPPRGNKSGDGGVRSSVVKLQRPVRPR